MTSVTNEDISNEGLRQRFIDHLLSEDFFASETYPEATITYTGAEATDEENRIDFAGNLTLRGVTDEVNGTAMLTPTEEDLVVAASFVIDRTNFDITYGSGSFFDNLGDTLIQDEVELEAVLTLVPESASDMAEEGMQDDENGTDTESVE
jgi:polyisoprenoid-binding protein YceI